MKLLWIRWWSAALMVVPTLLAINACSYTAPFRRVESVSPDAEVVLALTAVESRQGQRSAFFADTKRVLAGMPNQPGLIGYSFRFQILGRKAWTMSAWKDEASRDAFTASPSHRAAVKNSRVTSQNMRFINVKIPAHQLPIIWDEALRLLETAPRYE
jgi:quinol monooxygenase YgiN